MLHSMQIAYLEPLLQALNGFVKDLELGTLSQLAVLSTT